VSTGSITRLVLNETLFGCTLSCVRHSLFTSYNNPHEYSADLNALFLADLGYNQVHLWLGDDISRQDIANWRQDLLRLKAEYAARNPTIYPGHGAPTDMRIFDEMVAYIDDFTRVTESARSREDAQAQMIALYPDYAEADFFLKYSIENHVK